MKEKKKETKTIKSNRQRETDFNGTPVNLLSKFNDENRKKKIILNFLSHCIRTMARQMVSIEDDVISDFSFFSFCI